MSITNNNPFLINILPIGNAQQDSSGSDPLTTLRNNVNDIQGMVNFNDKKINVDIIAGYSQNNIDIINDVNINNSILTINNNSVTSVTSGSNAIDNRERGSEFMGSNSYGWVFPPSTIGGIGIKDATGIVRSNADTYTNAITKLDYWIYENVIDQPPAPKFADIRGTESNIGYYWSNSPQIKLGVLDRWVPYVAAIVMDLYSGVTSSSSNFYGRFVVGEPYIPYSTYPVKGVEFNNRVTPGSITAYSNSYYRSYILQIGVNSATANIANGPYSLVMNFSNYSINPVNRLHYGSNNFIILTPRAPLLTDFTVVRNNNGTLSVNIVPTTRTDTYLTPMPVYYYSISGTSLDISAINPSVSFNSGTARGVIPIVCGYNQSFNFNIYASNAIGISPTLSISANTGPAPVAATPGVSLSLSADYTNGTITASYATTNQDGTIHWQFTSPGSIPNGTGIVNETYSYGPSGYFQYFDTNFTIRARNIASCKQDSPFASVTRSINYIVPTPSVSVSLTGVSQPYTITATVPVPSLPPGLTYSTQWQVLSGTVISVSTNNNTTYRFTGSSTGQYIIGARFIYTDTQSRTRTSAQGQGSASPGPVPFVFNGSMGPNDQVDATYPANSVAGTPYATISGGYIYTGTPAPGNTITFQRESPDISYGATYTWGYSIQF